MEAALDFARGPLFVLTFGFMVLGLARHVLLQAYFLVVGKGRRLRDAPWRAMLVEAATWILPVRHLIGGTVLFSSASFLLHVGVIVVGLFLAEHIILWEALLGADLPAIGRGLADALSLTTLAALLVLLGCRVFVRRQRAVSRPPDYILLVIIMLPVASGFLCLHPGLNPLRWDAVMLIHVLSAELLFVLIPISKLAHMVTFLFDRTSAVHWQLRPGAGDRVALALFGTDARV